MPDFAPRPISPAGDETIVVRRAGPSSLPPGTVLGHTYVIERLLARGHVGDLYRARHVELGTLHTIKFVLPSLVDDTKIMQLLVEEARKLERVHSDAVIAHQGLFRGESNVRYLVTEYIEGDSLTKMLEQRRLEPDEVLHLRDRLAKGLAAAHEKGIIHRNLSPDNIILPDGDIDRAKLVEFGIAKPAELGETTVIGKDLTGEYAFASPEQTGLFGGRVDARSDIYSLGLVLAAAAIGFGKKLDMGATPTAIIAARERLPDLAAIPESLRPVIAPMLQPRPEDRPGSMRQLLDSVAGTPAPSRPSAKRQHWPTTRRLLLLTAAIVVLSVASGTAVLRIASPPPVADLRAQLSAATDGFQCASVDYDIASDRSVRLSGHLSTPGDIERLRRAVGEIGGIGSLTFGVRLMTWPHCQIHAILHPLLVRSNREAPTLSLKQGALHVGDQLIVDVRTPDFDGYLYIDYFDSEGEVLHLFPTGRDRFNLKPSRNHFVLGCPPLTTPILLEGKAGERTITLIATSKPLFPDPALTSEHARDYFARLSEAMKRLQVNKAAAAVLSFQLQDEAGSVSANVACPSR